MTTEPDQVDEPENGWSFPSGHATDATAVYLTTALVVGLWLARRSVTRVLLISGGVALSATIAASRLVLRVHWPTDVLAGGALGTAVAALVVLAVGHLARRSEPRPAGLTRPPVAQAPKGAPMSSPTAAPTAEDHLHPRGLLNKVPEVTVWFWVIAIIILAITGAFALIKKVL